MRASQLSTLLIILDPTTVARCRENAPGCTFPLMSTTDLKFPDNSFDNISCVEAAFHFVTREKFLKEAFRMLKPRGQIVLPDVLSAKHREEHGQHPQMYGLPETQLFATESLAARSPGNPQKAVRCRHRLIRAVAELYIGEQTEKSLRQAEGWLRRRLHVNTGLLFQLRARRVYPRMPVKKSPDVVYQMNASVKCFHPCASSIFCDIRADTVSPTSNTTGCAPATPTFKT